MTLVILDVKPRSSTPKGVIHLLLVRAFAVRIYKQKINHIGQQSAVMRMVLNTLRKLQKISFTLEPTSQQNVQANSQYPRGFGSSFMQVGRGHWISPNWVMLVILLKRNVSSVLFFKLKNRYIPAYVMILVKSIRRTFAGN